MEDIHQYKSRVETFTKRIKESSLSEQNKNDILEFKDFCYSQGLGHPRVYRYIWDLKKLAELIKKDFVNCNKQDVQRVLSEIEQTEYSHHTKRGFKVALKKFYKHIRGIDDKRVYPDEVRWITTSDKNNRSKLPEELLTEEEVMKMIGAATSSRDKAFISCLYESGCRIGEIALLFNIFFRAL